MLYMHSCFFFVMKIQHKHTSVLHNTMRRAPQSVKGRVSGKECILLIASQQPQPAAQGAHGEPEEEEENHDGAARLSLVRRHRGTYSFTHFKPQRDVFIHPLKTSTKRRLRSAACFISHSLLLQRTSHLCGTHHAHNSVKRLTEVYR